ncbi:LGFP repeat-containing protein [Agromyces sp. NPDC055520]
MTERMTHLTRPRQATPARFERRSAHVDRALSWSDFRAAVRHDADHQLLLAVPAISAKHAEHRWLGAAVGPHMRIGDGEMYRREFERGTVYWSARTAAHEVHGLIAEHWHGVGGETSFLGFPTTDEQPLAESEHGGRITGGFAHFEGGSIYWSPAHGPAIVYGMVRDIWALLGWERSALGLPVRDVDLVPGTGVLRGVFEHGTVEWSSSTGPVVVLTPAGERA